VFYFYYFLKSLSLKEFNMGRIRPIKA